MRTDIIKKHHGYIITEGDMELARYKYYFDQALDSIFDVCYRYKGMVNFKLPQEEIDAAVNKDLDFMVKNFYDPDDDIPPFLVKNFNERILLSYLDEDHYGDCIKQCCSCMRCYVERLIGCNTMPDNTPYLVEGESSCTLQSFLDELASKQEPLGDEFQKVLNENYWELITQNNNIDDSVDNM